MHGKVFNIATLVITTIGFPLALALIVTGRGLDLLTGVGIALFVPSYVLWVVARLQLGKSLAISAQAIELVTHGIYSKIRHPIYIFGALVLFGVALCLRNVFFFLLWLAIVGIQFRRAKKEEAVLEEKFGAAYREYRRATWF